jgi:hypothetical protein
MADRRTKAQLLALIERFDWECNSWKDGYRKQRAELREVWQELADLKARDRSPRRLSAARTSCRLQETCKFDALNVVLAWERDGVVEEQKQTILELRREVEEQKQTVLKLEQEVHALQSDKADMIQAKHQFVEEMRRAMRHTG